MDKVALAVDTIPAGTSRITRSPGWVQIRPTLYVHRPRSGWRYRDGAVGLRLWCGPYMRVTRNSTWWDREPTQADHDGQGVCGSCTGRAEAWLAERAALVFAPEDEFGLGGRVWCPADRYGCGYLEDPASSRLGLCLVCGFHGRCTGSGGVYAWRYGLKRHRIADGPGRPPFGVCPWHGWKFVRLGYDSTAHYLGHATSPPPTHVACRQHGCRWSTAVDPSVLAA